MKSKLIYIATIVIMFIIMAISIRQCNSYKHEYHQNLIALNDTIHQYKTKNNQLVSKTLSYETNIKDLKLLNEDLYNEVNKLKGKINTATNFTGTIVNEIHDTTFIVSHDTLYKGFSHDFNFNNEYRTLEGNVSYKPDSIKVNISKDIISFDYTVALDNKNNIHITSNNPYVKYNSISGFVLPKQKKKRFSVGPYIGYGIDISNGKPNPQVGIGLSYSIVQF